MIKNIAKGDHVRAHGPVPECMGLEGASIGSAEDARALFEQGLKETGLTIDTFPKASLLCGSETPYRQIAQAVQDMWREVLGVKVDLEVNEGTTVFSRIAGLDYTIGNKVWLADYNDPDNFLSLFKEEESRSNETGWHNSEYVSLVEEAALCQSVSRRRELLSKAQEIFNDEMPVIPIYHPSFSYLQSYLLIDVCTPPAGSIDFKWARLLK